MVNEDNCSSSGFLKSRGDRLVGSKKGYAKIWYRGLAQSTGVRQLKPAVVSTCECVRLPDNQ